VLNATFSNLSLSHACTILTIDDSILQEEKKFEAVEKEYEMAAELAKEEELELSLAKGLSSKK
jgi:hypothetical protein